MAEKEYLDDVQQTLTIGITGTPELRKEERALFLGEFKERVLVALTMNEVSRKENTSKVQAAMEDPRAAAVIVHEEVPYNSYEKYRELAEKLKLEFTVRYDPNFKGDIGLVVASDEALE